MSFIINPWNLGSELNDTPRLNIPNFTLAKYMVLRIIPPKGKTVRDGIVLSAALLGYFDENNQEVKTVKILEGPSGYEIEFPFGKMGILATKYRGPKSQYKFVNPATGKFYQISNEKFSVTYATQYLAESVKGFKDLSPGEQEQHIDEYLENMYMFGLSNDFAFDNSKDIILPKPGMVTSFYRRYTPPAAGEKYGNVIITKWPKKSDPIESKFPNLDGEFKMVDEAIAVAIQNALQQRDESTKFDPNSFDSAEDQDEDDSI